MEEQAIDGTVERHAAEDPVRYCRATRSRTADPRRTVLRSRPDQRRVAQGDRARSETQRKDNHLLDASDGSRRKNLRRHLFDQSFGEGARGSLRELKSSFGRNAVAVRCEGGDGVLDDPSLVSKVVRHADEMQALLAHGANAQTLLRRLIDSGATIGKFEMVEPSLNDIFITKVTEHQ